MNTATLAVTAAVTAAAGLVAGCTPNTGAPTLVEATACRAVPFVDPFSNMDPCSAEAVLAAAVGTVFSYRPHEHADPRAAFRAAHPLMDSRFAQEAEPSALVWVPISGKRWQQWLSDSTEITTSVRVTSDDHPPDAAHHAVRVLAVDLHPARQAPIRFAVYARAHRASASSAWLLSGMEVVA